MTESNNHRPRVRLDNATRVRRATARLVRDGIAGLRAPAEVRDLTAALAILAAMVPPGPAELPKGKP
jgi:hypothetical protein